MDGYGDHEIFFFFIGQGKQDAADDLWQWHPVEDCMGHDEDHRTEQKCRPYSPASEVPIEHAPEKNFFGHRTDDAAHHQEKKQVGLFRREVGGNQIGGMQTSYHQNDSRQADHQSKPCRPEKTSDQTRPDTLG